MGATVTGEKTTTPKGAHRVNLTDTRLAKLKPQDKRYRVHDLTPGFYAEVMPSGKIKFRMRYRIGGRDGIERAYTLRKPWGPAMPVVKARSIAIQKAAELERGVDIHKERVESERRDKADEAQAVRRYLEDRYIPNKLRHAKSGDYTESIIRTEFKDWLDLKMTDITLDMFNNWRNRREDEGASRATINRNGSTIRALLNHAYMNGVIPFHPLARVARLKERTDHRTRYLTPDEERRLRSALRERDAEMRQKRRSHAKWLMQRGHAPVPEYSGRFADYLEPTILLLLNTGCRAGEIRQLTWEYVDFHKRNLTVSAATSKSERARTIQLNREAMQILTDWQAQTGSKSGLVFPNESGKQFLRVKGIWARLLKRAEITDLRIHDLRHHFASKLVSRGTDLVTVKELLGHADLRMTDRYAHAADEAKRAAVESLNDIADNVVAGNFGQAAG